MPVISFLLYVCITSFTPGPNNIMALVSANQFGLKNTLKFCIGVGAGFFIIILSCCYFNLLLKNFIPKIEMAMTILGAAYMVYLAIKIMKSKDSGNDNNQDKSVGLFSAMLLQFINPKGILYAITVISTFVIPYYTSNISFLFFSLFLGFVGFVSTFCWALFGSLFQKFLSKYRTQFNVVMSLLLIYTAVSIFME